MGGTNRRGRGMAVVVRCAACNGLAQVGPEAVGLLVVCPRCHDPFLAEPVAAPAAPPPPAPPPEPDPPPGFRHRQERPPRPERPERPGRAPRPRRPKAAFAEESHDLPPHTGGVPFSVIIGLALLPLAIPLLWLLGPPLLGIAPAFTLATPTSLAVAAAALCLAVAYTVDWSAATRIKGVLTLVGLAYLTGFGLYFLKKTTVEWVEQQLGRGQTWGEIRGDGFELDMPTPAVETKDEPLEGLRGRKGIAQRFRRGLVCVAAAGPDPDPRTPDADWFDARRAAVLKASGGDLVGETAITHQDRDPGREWVVRLRTDFVRVVRVFRAGGRVYALSAEGRKLDPDDDDLNRLFHSFAITARK